MATLQREGQIQLKPVECYEWEHGGQNLGVRFDFVTREGDTVSGSFYWTKKDGGANPDLADLQAAFEKQTSILMEVAKGKEKKDGGHYYNAKWVVRDQGKKMTAADLAAKMKAKAEEAPAAPESTVGTSADLPF